VDSRPVERKPKDPTIREQFNTYRFADYKETADARDDGERSDCSHRLVDEKRAPMMETLYTSQNLFHFVGHSDPGDNLDCAPPAKDFSARCVRTRISDFSVES
jgi:hypothetical protein